MISYEGGRCKGAECALAAHLSLAITLSDRAERQQQILANAKNAFEKREISRRPNEFQKKDRRNDSKKIDRDENSITIANRSFDLKKDLPSPWRSLDGAIALMTL
jgi:hypothetical protein